MYTDCLREGEKDTAWGRQNNAHRRTGVVEQVETLTSLHHEFRRRDVLRKCIHSAVVVVVVNQTANTSLKVYLDNVSLLKSVFSLSFLCTVYLFVGQAAKTSPKASFQDSA